MQLILESFRRLATLILVVVTFFIHCASVYALIHFLPHPTAEWLVNLKVIVMVAMSFGFSLLWGNMFYQLFVKNLFRPLSSPRQSSLRVLTS